MSVRDYDLDDIVFTAYDGKTYTIKDMREYPPYQLWFQMNVDGGVELDEIASRNEIYGEGGESEYYKIAEFNKEALFDSKFDLRNMKTIDIPVQ